MPEEIGGIILHDGDWIDLSQCRLQFMPKGRTDRPGTFLVIRLCKQTRQDWRRIRDRLKSTAFCRVRVNSKGSVIFQSRAPFSRDERQEALKLVARALGAPVPTGKRHRARRDRRRPRRPVLLNA